MFLAGEFVWVSPQFDGRWCNRTQFSEQKRLRSFGDIHSVAGPKCKIFPVPKRGCRSFPHFPKHKRIVLARERGGRRRDIAQLRCKSLCFLDGVNAAVENDMCGRSIGCCENKRGGVEKFLKVWEGRKHSILQ